MPHACSWLVPLMLLAASPSLANVAATERNPGGVQGPRFAASNPLVVDREDLAFDCDEVLDHPTCAFEARYVVRNPTDAAVDAVGAFYGLQTQEVVVRVDGQEAGAELSDTDAATLDAAVAATEGLEELPEWLREILQRTGFEMRVEPGATAELVAKGWIEAGLRIESASYALMPVESRHLALGDEETDDVYDLEYLLAPINTWSDVHAVRIAIRSPSDWEFEIGFTTADPERRTFIPSEPDGDWDTSIDNGRRTAVFESDGEVPGVLAASFRPPARTFFRGGPYLGFGGTVGEGGGDFWMRWSYEIASPSWLLYSAAVDTNYDDRLVISPMVILATPMVFIMPSFDVGIGVPIQIMPATEVGIRLQAGFTIGPVGFVSSFDLYPSLDESDPDFLQIELMGVVTF